MRFVVKCQTLEQLMNVVEHGIKRGLLFVADADSLTIKFTGGY